MCLMYWFIKIIDFYYCLAFIRSDNVIIMSHLTTKYILLCLLHPFVSHLTSGPQLPPEIAAQILNSASQSPQSSLASTQPSTPSRSRSHSASPGPGVPMPPKEAPAPPPPPPPAQSPPAPSGAEITETQHHKHNKTETSTNSLPKHDW